MKARAFIATLLLNACAHAALPGVTEFKTPPEHITDAQLSALLHKPVAAADVIAIGETVHGSAGMLHIQTRLMRYLVTHHGLRLVVWENPTLRSLEFARWAASCTKAKSPPPVAVFYMPTAADVALWEWVCAFNLARPDDPIVFRGMDIWDRPWEHAARIRALGARTGVDAAHLKTMQSRCPARDAASWEEIEAIFGQVANDGKFQPQADYEACHAALTAILDAAQRTAMEKRNAKDPGADDAFELALSASTLLGWLGFYNDNWSNDILSWNARDRAQGRNLMLLMAKHQAARAIVSAHTSHVSHNRSPADWWGFGDIKSGVYFFAQMTGRKVFNIALTAHEASGTQGAWSLPAAGNSLDKTLHDAGHAFAYFASDAAFLSEHPRWWMQNQNFPGRYESGVEIVPRDHFDGFFFLRQSHLDKALPQRPMWQP
jgi:erythromycin esterase-like protein